MIHHLLQLWNGNASTSDGTTKPKLEKQQNYRFQLMELEDRNAPGNTVGSLLMAHLFGGHFDVPGMADGGLGQQGDTLYTPITSVSDVEGMSLFSTDVIGEADVDTKPAVKSSQPTSTAEIHDPASMDLEEFWSRFSPAQQMALISPPANENRSSDGSVGSPSTPLLFHGVTPASTSFDNEPPIQPIRFRSSAPSSTTPNTSPEINSGLQAGDANIQNDAPQANVMGELSEINVEAVDPTASEEGASTGLFQFTRDGDNLGLLTVGYNVGGTATAGDDYAPLVGTVTFPADVKFVEVRVTPLADGETDPGETVTVDIQPGPNYNIGANNQAEVTIADHPESVVSVYAQIPHTNEGGAGQLLFVRSGDVESKLTAEYEVSGSATPALDYIALDGTVSFAAGERTQTVAVSTVSDKKIESPEMIEVTLTGVSANASIGSPSKATVVIVDDDHLPVVNVTANGSVDEAGGKALFQWTREGGDLSKELIVNYSIGGGANPNGSKYGADHDLPSWGSITFPALVTELDLELTAEDDSIVEGPEAASIQISSSSSYIRGNSFNAAIVITDDDHQPARVSVNALNPIANETGGSGTFRIERIGDMSNDLKVYYTIEGTATPPWASGGDSSGGSGGSGGTLIPDYDITSKESAVIPADAAFIDVIVTPIDDKTPEGPETVNLTLSGGASGGSGGSGGSYSISSPSSATVVIIDDDVYPSVSIIASGPIASEGDSGEFTLRRQGDDSQELIVPIQIQPYWWYDAAWPVSDYESLPSEVVFAAGVNTVSLTVNTIDDDDWENPEDVWVFLQSGTNYQLGTPNSATVTIIDNEVSEPSSGGSGGFSGGTITITATDGSGSEVGPDSGAFEVIRTGDTDYAVDVYYEIAGSASAGYGSGGSGGYYGDYHGWQSIPIPAGSSSVTIPVPVFDDFEVEGPETVIVTIAGGGTSSASQTATVVIADNDETPFVSVAAGGDASEEGSKAGSFILTRTGNISDELTVSYSIGGSADAADGPWWRIDDHDQPSKQVTFAAGKSSYIVTVTPLDDTWVEDNEVVVLTISGTSYGSSPSYYIGIPQAGISILDNDKPPQRVSVEASNPVASEPSNSGTFTFKRDGDISQALTVEYTISGSATYSSQNQGSGGSGGIGGADHTLMSTGSVTFEAGASTVTLELLPNWLPMS